MSRTTRCVTPAAVAPSFELGVGRCGCFQVSCVDHGCRHGNFRPQPQDSTSVVQPKHGALVQHDAGRGRHLNWVWVFQVSCVDHGELHTQ
ncbi:hypothetical protein M413DRAFT_124738 [Hebeloma cylindrosporum]|uniref:Uncharacterized protein n=1 Tax=Hebeloma cylindrosporum TaxID=76867 RepID=A0A0C3C1Q6_HEBCY|nr:hypothetical protein M413DRAFT_124738 [Hebeloma cylindrosporum h7]